MKIGQKLKVAPGQNFASKSYKVKSVQSALTYLPTTSGPRDTFSRPSTTRGCISIIELLQFTIICSFWASLDQALFQKACYQDTIKRRKIHNCFGTDNFFFLGGGALQVSQSS